MADKIDLSLDEIIKKNRAEKKSTGWAPGGKPRQRNKKKGPDGNKGNIKSPGGFKKGGPKGANRPKPKGFQRPNDAPRRGGIATDTGPSKLTIANLDFGVIDSDIQELFSEFGKIRSAHVHYNKNGKSLGTAAVVFDKRSSALAALKQYNGVPLDGRPMNIYFEGASQPPPQKMSNPIPKALGGGVEKKGRNRNRRKSGPGGPKPAGNQGPKKSGSQGAKKGMKEKKPVITKEDLDKDLDNYLASR